MGTEGIGRFAKVAEIARISDWDIETDLIFTGLEATSIQRFRTQPVKKAICNQP
jgi:hypothetical protein